MKLEMDLIELIIVSVIILFTAIISFKNNSLNLKAIITAGILGLIIYLIGGIPAFTALLLFFLIAEISTKYSRKKLKTKHETRSISNIIGNAGIALISLILGFQIGFFGAIASSLSDTSSAEIGMLSKKKPRLITNLKQKVTRGTDGGITCLGLIAGLLTATIIGLIHYFFYSNIYLLIIISIAGFSGTIIDSILGAVLERKKILNNNQVNLIASLCGAMIAISLRIYFQII